MNDLFYNIIVAIIIIYLIASKIIEVKAYYQSTYAKDTGNTYMQVFSNSGLKGEYLCYNSLKKYIGEGKFIFNAYIPKYKGMYTEADLILILSSGIYVIESKNYKGWIFGHSKSRMWMETFPRAVHTHGRAISKKTRNQFFNPVFQNATHIKYLNRYLKLNIPYWSIIVFDDRCTFKDVFIEDDGCRVIKRTSLEYCIKDIHSNSKDILSIDEINEIYQRLYPLTQRTEEFKRQHIFNIKNKH